MVDNFKFCAINNGSVEVLICWFYLFWTNISKSNHNFRRLIHIFSDTMHLTYQTRREGIQQQEAGRTSFQRQEDARKFYSCQFCDKVFSVLSHVKRHEKIHTGDKSHSCEICGRSFTLKGNLSAHMLTHTGERPFSCEICGKKFARLSTLKTHQLVHMSGR